MNSQVIQADAKANFSRFNPDSTKGFYESYFVRANHPTEAKAFWIRYTIFAPKDQPYSHIGELWAIYFEQKKAYPYKEEFAWHDCDFPKKHFNVRVGNNLLNSANVKGNIGDFSWQLHYHSQEKPLFLLPLAFYNVPFPKAKSIVSQPHAIFNGQLKLGKRSVNIHKWQGSQNHNWGEKHTDCYAWGQVAGFDNCPDTFLELITAKLEVGKMETPFITLLVLRHEGKEYRFNSPTKWFANKGSFEYFEWKFECQDKHINIKGVIKAPRETFVGLRYLNPPGGNKSCLNTKLASCQLEIKFNNQHGGMPTALYCAHKCAFEILTDQDEIQHGIQINF